MKFSYPLRDPAKCLYIYTLPKAGTYLLTSLCEILGITNSGYHIGFSNYLDTRAHPQEINRHLPSTTRVNQQYIKTFRQCVGQLAFGHLSPSFLPPGVSHLTQVIAAFRDPFDVLVSEYNDFRFIRHDVKFCSIQKEADDVAAFNLYLHRQAPVIRDIMIEMSRYLDCFSDALYASKYHERLPIVINYTMLRKSCYIDSLNAVFANFLPSANLTFEKALQLAYAKPTKTKSDGYNFDINALWSSENYALIKPLRLKRLYRRLCDQEKLIRSALT